MSITVKDLLQMKEFDTFQLIAGKNGLNNIVTSATVMDTPDVHNWLKGGEILLTSGYIFQNDWNKLEKFIININKVGVSALFIDVSLYIKYFPEKLLHLANKLNLPVVSMPVEVAFRDVITNILINIADDKTRYLMLCAQMQEKFTNVILQGGNLQDVLDILGEILSQSVSYRDEYFNEIYYTTTNKINNEIENEFIQDIKNLSLPQIQAKYVTIPIENDNITYGYLILSSHSTSNNKDIDYFKAAINNVSTTLLLEIQKKISNINIYYRYINEFVISLIMNQYNSLADINHIAKLFNWKYENGVIIILIELHNLKSNSKHSSSLKISAKQDICIYDCILKKMKEYFLDYFSTVCTAYLNDTLIFMCQSENLVTDSIQMHKNISLITQNISTFLTNKDIDFIIGIGEYHQTLHEAHLSYTQAKEAIHIGKLLGTEKIIFHDTTGIYKLLETVYSTDIAKEYCNNVIGKLIDKDSSENVLFDTLLCIEKNDWNLKTTSKELFIHYNTIKYRYKSIEEILQLDLGKRHNQFIVTIAIILFKLREHLLTK